MTMLKFCQATAISAIVAQTISLLVSGAIITPNPSVNSETNGANNTILNMPGVGASGDFPPGPKPPSDPWPVALHYGDLDTPTLILFAEFSDVEPRNETQLGLIIEKAISQCSPFQIRNHHVQPQQEYEWSLTRDDMTMSLTIIAADDPVARESPYEPVGLTYNIWTNCLMAINRFRLAYPGVYFSYDIYIDAGGYKHLFVGYGTVSTRPRLAAPGLQTAASGKNSANQVATT